ncbi:hypothetical protein E4U41_004167 [Claviceps citrina]|nr:hypothetical protein E4U41_004167 [Claviceps citrina]
MAHSSSWKQRHRAASLGAAAPSISPLVFSPFALHRPSHSGEEDGRRTEETTCPHPRPRPRPRPRPPNSRLRGVERDVYAGDLHGGVLPEERMRARRARGDVAALVDFLDNHPPPPDNFMSRPEEDEEDEEDEEERDGRRPWARIRRMARRSRSMAGEPRRRQQRQLRLPDSAVAGVTIDGHRHIAISIPWEAAPFGGQDERSQYPVFGPRLEQRTPSKESVRTVKNEKGVVTVLRPVAGPSDEADAGDAGSAAAWIRRRPSFANPQALQRAPALPAHDYIGMPPTSFDSPSLLDDGSAPWHTPRRASSGGERRQAQNQTGHALQQQPFQWSGYPARVSSMLAGRAGASSSGGRNAPASVDAVMQRQDLPPVVVVTRADDDDAALSDSAAAAAAGRGSSATKDGDDRQRGHRIVAADHDTDDGRPSTAGSATSRTAVVRERKRRDVEAMRHAKLKEQLGRERVGGGIAQRPPPMRAHVSSEGGEATPAAATPGPTLTLCSLMVVMDVKPAYDTEPEPEPELDQARDSSETRAPRGSTTKPKGHSSPWMTAIRDQERRAREAVMAAQATEPQPLDPGGATYDTAAGTRPADEKEVLRLREAYRDRDQRLRDMERRLRRLELESNGAVWLQALVPVLDGMNRRSLLGTAAAAAAAAADEEQESRKGEDVGVGAAEARARR